MRPGTQGMSFSFTLSRVRAFANMAQEGPDSKRQKVQWILVLLTKQVSHVVLACKNCSTSHLKCDGKSPCFRCESRGLFCQYPVRKKYTVRSFQLTRPRTILACSNCRSKHRKCDRVGTETCSLCKKNGLLCTADDTSGGLRTWCEGAGATTSSLEGEVVTYQQQCIVPSLFSHRFVIIKMSTK